MTAKTGKKIRFLYGLLLSFSAAMAGICLIAACLSIYHSGGAQIYTAEKISAAFSQIAWGVYPFLALTVGSLLLELVLPPRPKAKKGSQTPQMQLKQLRSKANMQYCGPQLRAAIEAQQKRRKLHIGISFALLIVGSLIFLIYALDSRHFHQSEVNTSMINAMTVMLPCLSVPLGYGVFTAYHNQKSILKECKLLITVPKYDSADTGTAPRKPSFAQYLKWGLLIAAVALLVYGYFAGGTADVLTKAVNICTECVGLG